MSSFALSGLVFKSCHKKQENLGAVSAFLGLQVSCATCFRWFGFRFVPTSCLIITLVLACGSARGFERNYKSRPKVGLALSGGGAKGLAHIGVLKVLEELGVPVDYVAGTSMGAIIGGLYAAGYSPDSLSELVKQVDWQFAFEEQPARRLLRYDQKDEALKHLLEIGIASDQVFLPKGVVSGYKLTSLLTGLCLHVADIENFDHLPVPYRAVATDILNGDKVILDHGDLAKAMRASMSIPSVFPPYELHGRLLVDGGVVENMPVETVKAMGADIVIAVNVTAPLRTREQLNDLIDVMDQTIGLQMVKSTNISLGLADFVITPKVSDFGTFAFEQADTIIKLGEDAAREGQAGLIALLKALGEPLGGEDYPHTRPVKNILVSKVTLDGPQSYLPQLKLAAPFKPGEKISPEDLDLAVQKLYGLGDFESVSYRIVDSGEGRHEVCFTIKEKPGKVLTSVGLRVGFNSERVSRSQLDIRIRRPNTIFAGSYGWLDITLGRDLGAALGLNISNRPLAGLFLRPKIFINSYLHDVFYEQNMLAEFAVNSFGASIDTGFYLKTFGEITLGYIIKDDTLHNRIITVPVDEESHRLAGATASLKLDTLDRSPYPTKGLASVIKAVKMDKQLLSEENYTRLNWDGSVVAPLAARHTVEGNWSLGTSLNTDPPRSQIMFLGGYPGMLGYAYEEFMGNDLARFQLLYRYRLFDKVYIKLAGNAGAVWNSVDEFKNEDSTWYWGGGAGLAYDSYIGPVEATLGLGEKGRWNIYINYGYGF